MPRLIQLPNGRWLAPDSVKSVVARGRIRLSPRDGDIEPRVVIWLSGETEPVYDYYPTDADAEAAANVLAAAVNAAYT